jgi:hypothetical protein
MYFYFIFYFVGNHFKACQTQEVGSLSLFSHYHLEDGTYEHIKDGNCSFIYAFVNNIFIKPFYTVTLKIQIS